MSAPADPGPAPDPRRTGAPGGPADTGPRLRLGIAFHGDPLDPASWSGTPLGIARALRAQEHDVVGLSARAGNRADAALQRALAVPRMIPRLPAVLRGQPLGEAVDHAKSAARIGAEYKAVGTRLMARRLRAAGPLDAVLRLGTSFEVHHPRVVTFEDLTVQQAVAAGQLEWARVGRPTRRMRLRAQRRAFQEATACGTATPWAAASVVSDYGIDPAKVFPVGLGAHPLTAPSELRTAALAAHADAAWHGLFPGWPAPRRSAWSTWWAGPPRPCSRPLRRGC